MGLIKNIELNNGITLNYHRITSLNKITNISNNIEISSYINEAQREKERHYQDLQKRNANEETLTDEEYKELEKGINIFVESIYLQLPYDENMTLEEAYEYLKETDKFSGSRDI